jgi:hypothetical protein
MRAILIIAVFAVAAYLAFAPSPKPETYGDIARRECQREQPSEMKACVERKLIARAAERFSERP